MKTPTNITCNHIKSQKFLSINNIQQLLGIIIQDDQKKKEKLEVQNAKATCKVHTKQILINQQRF